MDCRVRGVGGKRIVQGAPQNGTSIPGECNIEGTCVAVIQSDQCARSGSEVESRDDREPSSEMGKLT
jgi:hypothetical protein